MVLSVVTLSVETLSYEEEQRGLFSESLSHWQYFSPSLLLSHSLYKCFSKTIKRTQRYILILFVEILSIYYLVL